MLDRLNQISTGAEHPDFVTLTLPDECFEESVAGFAKTAKLHLDILLKRLHRACSSACGFWRIEWKARKSGAYEGKLFPHFHLLVWGLPQRELAVGIYESFVPVRDCQQKFAGLCGEVLEKHVFKSKRSGCRFVDRRARHDAMIEDREHIIDRKGLAYTYTSFFDWVSMAWYDVVGSHNLAHFLAGCRVERIRTWGGVLSYCAKYMSKSDSENFMADIAVGRSWGIFNRDMMPWAKIIKIDLTDDMGNRIRRIARRFLEHRLGRKIQRHYGLTLYCDTKQFASYFSPPPDNPF
jgi:hypothetical protein